jgi:geranylgeranyl reductase family protein
MGKLLNTLESTGWQLPLLDQPAGEWDVIVAGAGPAGSIAAGNLAEAGCRVLLVDRSQFPRDKICGDALIPDSLKALHRAQLLDPVRSLGSQWPRASLFSPSNIEIPIDGEYLTLKRRTLDALIAHRAVGKKAVFCQGKVLQLVPGPRGGVELFVEGYSQPFRGRFGIIATGASVQLMQGSGMLERSMPSAVAVRCYVTSHYQLERLVVSYDRSIAPGYAWIFPLGNGEYNVGCGLVYSGRSAKKMNLREMLSRFLASFPLARELMQKSKGMSAVAGAPLRCNLSGSHILSKDGIVAIGESIGSTFPFTGEGIGKAMETAELAAKAILTALRSSKLDELHDLPRRIRTELLPRYRGYELAEKFVSHPWLIDLVAWRAKRSAALRRLMSGVIAETVDPARVFSLRGILGSLLG